MLEHKERIIDRAGRTILFSTAKGEERDGSATEGNLLTRAVSRTTFSDIKIKGFSDIRFKGTLREKKKE